MKDLAKFITTELKENSNNFEVLTFNNNDQNCENFTKEINEKTNFDDSKKQVNDENSFNSQLKRIEQQTKNKFVCTK